MGPLAATALLVAVLLAAGCGSGDGATGSGSAPGQARYDLTITYWPLGRSGPSRQATLTCEPNGGTHPDPETACAALAGHQEALHPVPLDMACTEIYGGPGVARVTGLIDRGQTRLTARFSRTNGCEISRWEALAPLLELPG